MDDFVIILLCTLGPLFLILILTGVTIRSLQWWTSRQAVRRAERETELKKEMLARGLSVEEIERLLRATAEQPKKAVEIDDEDVDVLDEPAGLLGCCEPDAKPDAIE